MRRLKSAFQTNGYYADTLSGCQVFHYCGYSSSVFGSIKYTTLCPNGTIFNQETLICDWWYKVRTGVAASRSSSQVLHDFFSFNVL